MAACGAVGGAAGGASAAGCGAGCGAGCAGGGWATGCRKFWGVDQTICPARGGTLASSRGAVTLGLAVAPTAGISSPWKSFTAVVVPIGRAARSSNRGDGRSCCGTVPESAAARPEDASAWFARKAVWAATCARAAAVSGGAADQAVGG